MPVSATDRPLGACTSDARARRIARIWTVHTGPAHVGFLTLSTPATIARTLHIRASPPQACVCVPIAGARLICVEARIVLFLSLPLSTIYVGLRDFFFFFLFF